MKSHEQFGHGDEAQTLKFHTAPKSTHVCFPDTGGCTTSSHKEAANTLAESALFPPHPGTRSGSEEESPGCLQLPPWQCPAPAADRLTAGGCPAPPSTSPFSDRAARSPQHAGESRP